MQTTENLTPCTGKQSLSSPTRPVFTVRQFAERNAAFSESALRNLIHKADTRHSTRGDVSGNGLAEAGAIIRVGRKVLIDEARFFDWIDAQAEGARKATGGRHA